MKNRDDGIFLLHIVDSFEKIGTYLAGIREDVFKDTPLLQDAVIRNYEIIGEAAKNISEDLRSQHPEIDWKGMAGFRNILVHQYFGVDLRNIWNISQSLAPETLNKIRNIPEYRSAVEQIQSESE